MLQFMFGDLKKSKIAFLLDIGGGNGAALKAGIYIKGFEIKVGYFFPVWYFSLYNFTIDLGYKFSWKKRTPFYKKKINK